MTEQFQIPLIDLDLDKMKKEMQQEGMDYRSIFIAAQILRRHLVSSIEKNYPAFSSNPQNTKK